MLIFSVISINGREVRRKCNFLLLRHDGFPFRKRRFKKVIAEFLHFILNLCKCMVGIRLFHGCFAFVSLIFFLGFKVVLRMERDNFVSSLVINSWQFHSIIENFVSQLQMDFRCHAVCHTVFRHFALPRLFFVKQKCKYLFLKDLKKLKGLTFQP